MKICLATIDDLDVLVSIENECFPPAEAATKESFADRLKIYPNHFWVLKLDSKIIGFINGMVTNDLTISDEMFEHAGLHCETGDWQAVFGLDVLPEYRRNGYAARLMEQLIADAKHQNRKGCILTCKEYLINYYEKFGYRNYGVSSSVHGGEVWYDMRLEF